MALRISHAGILSLLVATNAAVISQTGQTFVINDIDYYAAPDSVTIIDATADMLSSASTNEVDLIPLTVMADSTSSFITTVFRSLVTNYTASDDVFNIGFLQGKNSQSDLLINH